MHDPAKFIHNNARRRRKIPIGLSLRQCWCWHQKKRRSVVFNLTLAFLDCYEYSDLLRVEWLFHRQSPQTVNDCIGYPLQEGHGVTDGHTQDGGEGWEFYVAYDVLDSASKSVNVYQYKRHLSRDKIRQKYVTIKNLILNTFIFEEVHTDDDCKWLPSVVTGNSAVYEYYSNFIISIKYFDKKNFQL